MASIFLVRSSFLFLGLENKVLTAIVCSFISADETGPGNKNDSHTRSWSFGWRVRLFVVREYTSCYWALTTSSAPEVPEMDCRLVFSGVEMEATSVFTFKEMET